MDGERWICRSIIYVLLALAISTDDQPEMLIYCSLFAGERRIHLSEVSSREMIHQSGRGGGRYLLAVTARDITTRINFKVFSREAARELFRVVDPNQSLPSVGFGRSFDPRK